MLSVVTDFLGRFVQKAKHAVLLTGTPALSRPIELFKQVSYKSA